MNRDISIPSVGMVRVMTGPFKYLAVTSATLPFEISFDGNFFEDAGQNFRADKSQGIPPEKYFVRAKSGLVSDVSITVSDSPISQQDTAVSVQQNVTKGCGGAKNSITVNQAQVTGGGAYDEHGATPVNLSLNNLLVIPGESNGRKRKTIQFDNRKTTLGKPVAIFNAAGELVKILDNGEKSDQWETSDTFYVGGCGGNANKFTFFEIFYAKAN